MIAANRKAGTLLSLVVASALAFATRDARADEVQDCIDASERGQADRARGKLLDARASFARCAAPTCPHAIASDCTKWVDDIGKDMPRIVVAVVDEKGIDVVDARVTIDDGGPVPHDGRPVEVDPGAHRVRVERTGASAVTMPFVARVGEHDRIVRVVLHPTAASSSDAPATSERSNGVPPLAIAFGVTSLVAAATFGVFAVITERRYDDLSNECRPLCSASDVSGVKTTALVADVALGVSLVSLVAAGAVTLFGRSER